MNKSEDNDQVLLQKDINDGETSNVEFKNYTLEDFEDEKLANKHKNDLAYEIAALAGTELWQR